MPQVGGATGLVGDPSGRSEERPLLSPDNVRANVEELKKQLQRMLGDEIKVCSYSFLSLFILYPLYYILFIKF